MEWDRKDLEQAARIKGMCSRIVTTYNQANIVPDGLALQWLDELIKYLKSEITKPKPDPKPVEQTEKPKKPRKKRVKREPKPDAVV
jgi:hypothetical protein